MDDLREKLKLGRLEDEPKFKLPTLDLKKIRVRGAHHREESSSSIASRITPDDTMTSNVQDCS